MVVAELDVGEIVDARRWAIIKIKYNPSSLTMVHSASTEG